MVFRVLLAAWTMLFMAVSAGFAKEEVKKIEDNSFLIEEAYNQEPGVIQHIQSFQYNLKNKQWAYVFVQEWPVPGRTHQFSYNIPIYRLTDGGRSTGLGDVQLNYRYQLIYKEDYVAMAPRLSLLLPTGDYRKGFGKGAVGFQTNLPLSLTLSDKWVTHWNAGMTVTPNARGQEGGKAHAVDFNRGASVIYLLHENFNLMLETAYNAINTVDGNTGTQVEHSLFINPGFRFAINFQSGLQIVPGIGFPIGIGPSRGEYGVFFYLSFEHPFPFLYGKNPRLLESH